MLKRTLKIIMALVVIAISLMGFASCAEKHEHVFDRQIAEGRFMVEMPTCTTKAKYYLSCECGEHGTATFEYGETIAHNYNEQKIENDYLCKAVTCSSKATYYYACKCGAKGTATFEYGETLPHTFADYVCTKCGYSGYTVSKNLEYTLSDDGTYYSVAGIGTETNPRIIIPSEYNGLPVKFIASLSKSKAIKAVVISDGITTIGAEAFKECTSLAEIMFADDSVVSIGRYAFRDCTRLTSIVIPNSVTSIGSQAFSGCTSLTSVTIGNSVTSIGGSAFKGCNVSDIYITDIGAWCDISGLKELMSYGSKNKKIYLNGIEIKDLVIPNGLTTIGSYAFRDCANLTSVVIPDSVTTIGDSAFGGCDNLNYNEYGNALYLGNSVNPYFALIMIKDSGMSACDIHSTAVIIADCAFSGCTSLTSVTIGNNLTSIGDGAFYDCTSLTSVVIPDSVTSIGSSAFYGCYVSDIYITDIGAWCDISGLGELMSYGSNNRKIYLNGIEIKDLIIPNGVTTICNYAFRGCGGLKSVVIPDSVTSIGDSAFGYCKSLTSVTIGNSVTSIGSSAINSERDFRKTQQKISNNIENSLQMIA